MPKQKDKITSNLMGLIFAEDRFIILDDGWIKDKLTGLDWGPSSAEEMTFIKAETYWENLGGRLPTIHEIFSLVDFSKRDPASQKAFADMKLDWYWTGTTVAGNSDVAWCVNFHSGNVDSTHKDNNNFVRPVRPSQ